MVVEAQAGRGQTTEGHYRTRLALVAESPREIDALVAVAFRALLWAAVGNDNRRMLEILARVGRIERRMVTGGVVELVVTVPPGGTPA